MPEWEYCVIRGIHNTPSEWRTMYARHYLFTPNGPQLINDFRKVEHGLGESMSVARAIAILGEQGWELVGVTSDGAGSPHSPCTSSGSSKQRGRARFLMPRRRLYLLLKGATMNSNLREPAAER